MNSRIILVAAVVLVAASMSSATPRTVADTCLRKPQRERPMIMDDGIKDTDNVDAIIPKMFRAYVKKDKDGETLYQPLVLTAHNMDMVDRGESLVDKTKPAILDKTIFTDCATIRFSVTETRPIVQIIYKLKDMTFNFGEGVESCKLTKIEADEADTHAYACMGGPKHDMRIATLIIQRMELHKILDTKLPLKHDVLLE